VAHPEILKRGGGSSGDGNNMLVGANAWGLGDGSPPARSIGVAPVKGLGDKVPRILETFRKLCANLVKSHEEF